MLAVNECRLVDRVLRNRMFPGCGFRRLRLASWPDCFDPPAVVRRVPRSNSTPQESVWGCFRYLATARRLYSTRAGLAVCIGLLMQVKVLAYVSAVGFLAVGTILYAAARTSKDRKYSELGRRAAT